MTSSTAQKVNVAPKIEASWAVTLADEFKQPYFADLKQFLRQEHQQRQVIYPKGDDIFNAFKFTPFSEVKVVILGQDPYHGPNQAHGLAFSVPGEQKLPPSLQNIFKELAEDLGVTQPPTGDLTPWAKQGVLLLNTALTVRAHEAHSHRGQGWENFTDAVIKVLSAQREGVIFVLWGGPARSKKSLIDTNKHAIIESAHPSPLSAYRGFFGSKPFSQINNILLQQKQAPINWQLPASPVA